ncbi:hypothetical protein D9M71_677990 [compost metagenome]
MSPRAMKWPMQWCAPAPKPKCGWRLAVMSKPGFSNTRGSVPAAWLNRCTVVPFFISRPWNSKSSSASRVTQVTVGRTRITSSTAARASSGSSPSSVHCCGCWRKVSIARLIWFRVVSMPPKIARTIMSYSSCSLSVPSSVARTRLLRKSSPSPLRRAASTACRA